ncbi:hypothetical protein EU527_15535 [Candidatus Thorarchaeota archaeon]|nr:MAG: hypothetical protein EU527_15535 [Candidatus Thorarchaeota archaeon]
MQAMFIAITKQLTTYGAISMPDDKKELEEAVMEEFEWALQDPNTEKIRQLGEVVSIITTKLTEAISELQVTVNQLQSKVGNLDSKIDSLASRVSGGATVSASPVSGAGSEPIPTMERSATAPPPSAGGGMSMMGELKQLLAARRRKADTTE